MSNTYTVRDEDTERATSTSFNMSRHACVFVCVYVSMCSQVSLTIFLYDPLHAFCQRQGVVMVTAKGLSQFDDVLSHDLKALLLLVKGLRSVRESLVQLLNTHQP